MILATVPKTAFSFEDTLVSLNASIHDVVVGVSAKQLPDKHRHLRTTLTLQASVFFTMVRLSAYDRGSIGSGNCILGKTITNGRRTSEEHRIGNLNI